MIRRTWSMCLLFAGAIAITNAADASRSDVSLTAAQIADKNIAARGGLQAWRNVQALTLSGKLAAGGNQRATVATTARRPNQVMLPPRPAEEVQLPFVMELKRPRKMRFELQFNGATAVQVFDGTNGWKLRPFLNRNLVESYTSDELKIAGMQPDLDGPLIDYAAKGTIVALEGIEKVEERDTYKLKLTMRDGHTVHVWIDTATFLETKIEGQPRRLDGVNHPVEVYFRDYRPVGGLQIPYMLETKVLPVSQANGPRQPSIPSEKTVVDKVEVNPTLGDLAFSKPQVVSSASR
jgi:outer membrane lipoprotein-sorting protein